KMYAISISRGCSPKDCRNDWERLLTMRAEGALRPIVGATVPLDEVSRAHELLDRSGVVGRIVLDCS
ncbi:MAG: zinc-binding dehydrogenase, partial [Myxococcales bacterium]|nr:zinc-binding dehydrogenase [Myxococcales bacterium]